MTRHWRLLLPANSGGDSNERGAEQNSAQLNRVAFEQHLSKKLNNRTFRLCLPTSLAQKLAALQVRLCNPARQETVIMNPRLAAMAALCREVAIPASVVAFASLGSAGIGNTGGSPIVDRLAPLLAANATITDKTFADKPPPIAASTVDVVAAGRSLTEVAAADLIPAAREAEPIVTAALTNSSEMLAQESPPDQAAKADADTATREPDDAIPAAGPTEVLDKCLDGDTCIDRYLWTLYECTPKEDAIKLQERRKVTVRKKGRLVTVTRTFTTLADEDFAWKDPKAAEHVGMSMADYVIGGVERDFKLKLFHMLRAADEAGLSPGITSAFRDDYRQSIASGLKAANDRSYHGGSSRGGYGHGLAADIVSVKGVTRAQRLASSQILWNWVDEHGKEFGIGRPYLDRDPPHVAPIDGKEYADHHHGMKSRLAGAKPHNRLASRDGHGAAKRAKTAGSSRVRAT
jgi:D-alanyl-D-alanine carboxypeptidase